MGTKYNLEKLADELLSGNINSKKAEKLIRSQNIQDQYENLSNLPETNYDIKEEDNHLKLINEEQECLAYVCYHFDPGRKSLWLDQAVAHEQGKGHFKKLYQELEEKAKLEGAQDIMLEVDYNSEAYDIYASLGFFPVATTDYTSSNIDRWLMKKRLD